MKKQSHQHKVKFSEDTELDYNQLKTRTIISLDKLGHQDFSAEAGGYSLENWTRGVNLLLDEFEEKVGAANLTSEYAEKRRELTECLLKPVDVSSIDKDLSELKQNEAEVVRKLDEARTRAASRVGELKEELAKCSAEIEKEKARLSSLATERHTEPFFKRLFGRNSKALARVSEDKIKELESRLGALPGEILEQQKSLKSIDQDSPESPWAGEWRRLGSLQARLKELENERLEKVELVDERKEITASIASTISRISLGEDKTGSEVASSS